MKQGEMFSLEDIEGTRLEKCEFIELTESISKPGTYKVVYKTPSFTRHQRLSGIKSVYKIIS